MRRQPLITAVLVLVFAARVAGQTSSDRRRADHSLGLHALILHAPDATLLNNDDRGLRIGLARVSSATLGYQYESPSGNWILGAFGGPAMSHPRLRGLAGRWSGFELGASGGLGRYFGPYVWMGFQSRISLVRSRFRIDGFVPVDNEDYFRPVQDVQGALRQNNFELSGVSQVFLGSSGLFVSGAFGLVIYRRGIFSDADLYPGFTSNGGLFLGTTRLAQGEYHGSLALRARLGLGWQW